MKPSEQIFARAERMRKRGHRAYAMFLRRDAKMVAKLEAELADWILTAQTHGAIRKQLEAELEIYSQPATCNSGHTTLPIKLWDCPDCTAEIKAKNEKMNDYIEQFCDEDFVMWCREQDALLTGGDDAGV